MRRVLGIGLCWLITVMAAVGWANDFDLDVRETPLHEIELDRAPGATTVITAEEIERSGAANIYEVLRGVPGVDVRYTPMGGHIAIRGTGSSPFTERVLLLVDGSPINSPDKGGFPGHPNFRGFFPLDRIQRVEIVKGPISVVYGANAFSGVINIVTRQPAETVASVEGQTFDVELVAGEQQAAAGRASVELIRGNWEATVRVAAEEGVAPIKVTDSAELSTSSLYASVRRGPLRASFLQSESEADSFPVGQINSTTARHRVQIADMYYSRRVGNWTLNSSAMLNRYRGTTCATCHNPEGLAPNPTSSVEDDREENTRVRLALEAAVAIGDRQDFVVGGEVMRDRIERSVLEVPDAPERLDSGGVYMQHVAHLGAAAKLRLVSGMRLDWSENLGTVLSPRVAVLYEPPGSDRWSLNGSWTRAYRAPTWNERYIDQRFLPEEIAPNVALVFRGGGEGLERERITAVAAGAAYRVAPRTVVRVDLYDQLIDEFIAPTLNGLEPGTPNLSTRIYQNRATAFRIRGGEVTVRSSPAASLELTASYGFRDSELEIDEDAGAYAPTSRFSTSLHWQAAARWGLTLRGAYNSSYGASAPDVFGVREQPGYEIVDAALRYFWDPAGTRTSIGLIGRNLTDSNPFETRVSPTYDTGLRGRQIVGEVRVRF